MASPLSLASLIARPGFVPKEPLRGGPPLDAASLTARLEHLLQHDPALFLERYGGQLQAAELAPFEGGGYEVQWHLKRLLRSTQQREQERRNRRYRRMTELLRDTDYFSVERMQERAPQLCRRYLGATAASGSTTQGPLSSRLLASLDQQAAAQLAQNDEEEEEEDEDEDDEGEGEGAYEARAWKFLQEEGSAAGQAPDGGGGGGGGGGAAQSSAEGEGEALEELRMVMQERFLSGEDGRWFDYRAVDEDDRYDDGEQALDAEEAYFDDSDEDEGRGSGMKRGRGAR
jgi:hypothetical protein